ncbi:hypothetical protein GCM10009733_085810 [Nonomuraea maheshkhaliensis]|uniref:Cytochrome P450 n=1 Tax=Nonomuraea maheshkhaliensis TaxID=419590 RepID=A0ABP4SUW4_9ACTN
MSHLRRCSRSALEVSAQAVEEVRQFAPPLSDPPLGTVAVHDSALASSLLGPDDGQVHHEVRRAARRRLPWDAFLNTLNSSTSLVDAGLWEWITTRAIGR